jgi:radical SAM superfamily enzyme YgiQ (UPF0313 family)
MNVILLTCVSGTLYQRALGAYQLAFFLREHGYTVQVIDFTDDLSENELIKAVDKYMSTDTLCIGISTTFYNNFNVEIFSSTRDYKAHIPKNIKAAIEYSKQKHSNIKVVLGGAKSLTGEHLDFVDCVIHGYGEDKMLDFLNRLDSNPKRIKNKIITLDQSTAAQLIIHNDPLDRKFDIQKTSHRFIDQDYILPNETLPIEISRGCIFKCKFCAYPLTGKKKFDYIRDPKLIYDEMMYNYENFNTTNYFFGDDTLNDSTFKIEKLHKSITSLPFKIKFTSYLRLDLLHHNPEQISMLKEMGLASPFFGIESLNQRSASSVGKGMDVNKVKEFLLELYNDHWNKEIPIYLSLIIGLPYETEKSMRETFQWVKETELSASFQPLSILSQSIYKSEFEKNIQKYGYTVKENGYWENENMNVNQAEVLSKEFNEALLFKSRPASWFLMTLLNHNMTLDQCSSMTVSDLNWTKIILAKKKKIAKYKSLLLRT